MKPRIFIFTDSPSMISNFYSNILGFIAETLSPTTNLLYKEETPMAVVSSESEETIKIHLDDAYVSPGKGQRFYILGLHVDTLKSTLLNQNQRFEYERDEGFGHTLVVPDPEGRFVCFWEELYMSDQEIIQIYKNGPEQLKHLLQGLLEEDLDLKRAPGKWSIRETIHHLVDSDITTANKMKFALTESGRNYKGNPYSPDVWAKATHYSKRGIQTTVDLFTLTRKHILEVCEALQNPLGFHLVEGQSKTHVRTMMKMVGGHARGHFKQIEETIEKHLKKAVVAKNIK